MSNGNSHFHLHCSWRFFEMGTIRCFSHHYPSYNLWSQCTTMPQPGYTVTLIAFNDTTLTSTLSRTAENGITVSYVGGFVNSLLTLTTIGSSMIQLVGELQLVPRLLSVYALSYIIRSTRTTVYHQTLHSE